MSILLTVMSDTNPGRSFVSFESPSGKSISFRLNSDEVTALQGERKQQFYDLVRRAKEAIKSRAQWRDQNFPDNTKDEGRMAVYSAKERAQFPPGMTTAYMRATKEEMIFLINIKQGKNEQTDENKKDLP